MFRSFFPDEYLDSAYVIDYEKLYREGYRGLLFDIDNTIVPHGAPADERAKKLFQRLRKIGFHYCFVSNNKKPRVEPFARAVEGDFVENAHKPAVKNYRKACQMIGTDPDRTIFVGDQLFTDIYGAKRAGIRTILVKPSVSLFIKLLKIDHICRIQIFIWKKTSEHPLHLSFLSSFRNNASFFIVLQEERTSLPEEHSCMQDG